MRDERQLRAYILENSQQALNRAGFAGALSPSLCSALLVSLKCREGINVRFNQNQRLFKNEVGDF